ncbi:MAG: TIGR02453 family protein [Gammaproteobacteria bacterium]|nr:TIGR02453 family protein [Gammaproteobacteria bacterium]
MAPPRYVGFERASIEFLEQLAANNNREWFNENRSRYEEHVLDVALRFIQSMQDPIAQFAPHFTAIPQRVGGSLMRVYRDTRFSKNKLPYKTNIGIQFRHEQARDVHSPGYYVHVDPEQVFLGVGMWRPDSDALQAIRQRIVARPSEWQNALGDAGFRRHFELGGESLSRAPRGFPNDHELIEDIKRKSFIAVRNLEVGDALSPGFQRKVEASFIAAAPFMNFLCKAVGVPF